MRVEYRHHAADVLDLDLEALAPGSAGRRVRTTECLPIRRDRPAL
jgi:hypothetical protein